jgi:hypothetical protein
MKNKIKQKIKRFWANSKMVDYIPTKKELKKIINPFEINEENKTKEACKQS